MRKRIVCLVLCAVMTLTAVCGLAADYTMSEKLIRQLNFGSGLKGSVVFTLAGDAPWVQMLAPLSGVDLELRAIHSDTLFQYQLYALDGETQYGLTQLYGNETTMGLRSDLLPDTLLTMATGGDPIDQLTGGGEAANPTWYSAALNLLTLSTPTWTDTWTPALQPYFTDIELWLKAYGSAPSVTRGTDGSTLMLMRYDIPAAAVKEEMNALLAKMLADNTLMTLLRAQTTTQQQGVYLNDNLLSYYASAIEALPLIGQVTLERELTTMGAENRMSLSFPLPENEAGWTSFRLEQSGGDMTFGLSSDGGRTLELVMKEASSSEESASYQGILRVHPAEITAEERALSASFHLTKAVASSVDDDTREHNITTWTLAAEPDLTHLAEDDPARADYLDFDPLAASLTIHFHSKNAPTSPTTLEVNASLTMQDAQVSLAATMKSTSPWVMQDLPLTGGEDVSAMTETRRLELLSDFGASALIQLTQHMPASLPLPSEDAPTDAPEVTDAPTDVPEVTDSPTDVPEATDAPTDVPETTDAPTDAPEATDAPDEATEAPSLNGRAW